MDKQDIAVDVLSTVLFSVAFGIVFVVAALWLIRTLFPGWTERIWLANYEAEKKRGKRHDE